ncbi:MAG: hypothetical protein ACFE9S_20415 [Candidatus Hermodarchaeota archaeon]
MSIKWEIGKEAQELDEKPIKERMKIERNSIKRVGYALILYFITMVLFYFCL